MLTLDSVIKKVLFFRHDLKTANTNISKWIHHQHRNFRWTTAIPRPLLRRSPVQKKNHRRGGRVPVLDVQIRLDVSLWNYHVDYYCWISCWTSYWIYWTSLLNIMLNIILNIIVEYHVEHHIEHVVEYHDIWLVLWNIWINFPSYMGFHGISSSQLTKSIIFQDR